MNIAFTESADASGITRTRASLTALDRPSFAGALPAGERLESFLYASPPGVPWPCGPTPEQWALVCDAIARTPELGAAVEATLAASRHRFLVAAAEGGA